MATHTLKPLSHFATNVIVPDPLDPLTTYLIQDLCAFQANGNIDRAVCIRVANDGLTNSITDNVPISDAFGVPGILYFFFQDDLVIPPSATINSIQLQVRHSGAHTGIDPNNFPIYVNAFRTSNPNQIFGYRRYPGSILFDPASSLISLNNPALVDLDIDPNSQIFSMSYGVSSVMLTNLDTGLNWTRADLFRSNAEGAGCWGVEVARAFGNGFDEISTYTIDFVGLIVDYSGLEVTSASPNHGGVFGGASVAITGAGFTSGTVTKVLFGFVQASGIFVLNDTTLTCYSPAHDAGAVNITVFVEDDLGEVTSATSSTAIFTYEQYSFELENTEPVKEGNKIKIRAPISPIGLGFHKQPGVLNRVAQVLLTYTDPISDEEQTITINNDGIESYYIIVQQYDNFWFYLPIGFRFFSGPVTVTLVGDDVLIDGIQFSGSVVAGTLQVLFEDASGIYVLDSDQTNDTLYFRDGNTTDIRLLMLTDFLDEGPKEDDFWSMMTYPRKILSRTLIDEEDYGEDDFLLTAIFRISASEVNVEIPSPFVTTAFLP